MIPVFFVHIPKTAGTSFRLGAEDYFPPSSIEYDYGYKSPNTTRLVKELVYERKKDFWEFGKHVVESRKCMVGGHVNINRFLPFLGVENTVSFLRDPLRRMYSEYSHFVRHYEYKGSFHDFYSRPMMHNRQSKMLQGVDLEAIGFLGITENYNESLEMLNNRYSLNILQRKDNRDKSRIRKGGDVSSEDVNEFSRLNKRDIAVYKNVHELFDYRYSFFKKNLAWVHARLVEAKPGRIAGWAWWEGDCDDPVEIEVWANGEYLDTVSAVEFRPALCRHLPPRGGYVGFHLPVKLAVGDKVQCRVASTGQLFPVNPRSVVKPEAK